MPSHYWGKDKNDDELVFVDIPRVFLPLSFDDWTYVTRWKHFGKTREALAAQIILKMKEVGYRTVYIQVFQTKRISICNVKKACQKYSNRSLKYILKYNIVNLSVTQWKNSTAHLLEMKTKKMEVGWGHTRMPLTPIPRVVMPRREGEREEEGITGAKKRLCGVGGSSRS